eukprot:7357789-Prymnesium_polylepis.2
MLRCAALLALVASASGLVVPGGQLAASTQMRSHRSAVGQLIRCQAEPEEPTPAALAETEEPENKCPDGQCDGSGRIMGGAPPVALCTPSASDDVPARSCGRPRCVWAHLVVADQGAFASHWEPTSTTADAERCSARRRTARAQAAPRRGSVTRAVARRCAPHLAIRALLCVFATRGACVLIAAVRCSVRDEIVFKKNPAGGYYGEDDD